MKKTRKKRSDPTISEIENEKYQIRHFRESPEPLKHLFEDIEDNSHIYELDQDRVHAAEEALDVLEDAEACVFESNPNSENTDSGDYREKLEKFSSVDHDHDNCDHEHDHGRRDKDSITVDTDRSMGYVENISNLEEINNPGRILISWKDESELHLVEYLQDASADRFGRVKSYTKPLN